MVLTYQIPQFCIYILYIYIMELDLVQVVVALLY